MSAVVSFYLPHETAMRPIAAVLALTVFAAARSYARQSDSQPKSSQPATIAGHWTYNAEQSTDPRSMTQVGDSGNRQGGRGGYGGGGGRGGFGGGRGGFGGGRGGMGGGRGGAGGPGGGMNDAQRAKMRQTMQLVWDAPQSLEISQTDSTVSLIADTTPELVLPVNGKKVVIKQDSLADVEVKGKWQGDAFVVQRKVSGGGTISEDYLHSASGNQLFVIVSFDTPSGRSLQFRRVYDGS